MKKSFKKICCFLVALIVLLSVTSVEVYAGEDGSGYISDDQERLTDDDYEGGSGSGYIPDDQERLTSGSGETSETTAPTEKNPAVLTDEQKQQIESMIEEARWYTSDGSVGNPIAPPYDEAYTKEMGEISNQIVNEGNELLYNDGDQNLLNSINSDYARLLTLLENPIINQQFAAYTCYLSLEEHDNNNWYDESEWQQFVEYRNALYDILTGIKEDYLSIQYVSLTYMQKKEITVAFFNLLELYDKMTLDGALLGDVDGDGDVSVLDVTKIQRYLARSTEFTKGQMLRATTNVNASNNGPRVDVSSVTTLQRRLVGIDSENFNAFQTYNFPPKEIRPTHSRYPDPSVLNQRKYRNVSIWNPIICITKWYDERLEEIESQN